MAEWLSRLEGPGYVWNKDLPGATDVELAALEAHLGRALPISYEEYMHASNGGTLQYRDLWYVRLWKAENVAEWSEGYGFTPENMQGAIAIGDDGGDEALVFDMRVQRADAQYPVYTVDLVRLGWDEAIKVADNFQELLLLRRRHIVMPHDDPRGQ